MKNISSHDDLFHLQSIRVYGGEVDEEQEEQFYLQRLEAGLFTLQLVDYIMLEACQSGPPSVSIFDNNNVARFRKHGVAFQVRGVYLERCTESGKLSSLLTSCRSTGVLYNSPKMTFTLALAGLRILK